MRTKTSISVNIIRDNDRLINYLPTGNGINAISNIIDNFSYGFHSNVIIGSYGTGKSSLMWAFEQTLKGHGEYFNIDEFPIKKGKVEFIRFVGEYNSIITSFAEQLGVKTVSPGNQQIFDAIYQQYDNLKKDGLLVIMIDELGKYLEHAAKNETARELYFIQQLAEFVNHPKRNILLIASLHQNFESYGFGLDEQQRNEWAKVKGRLKEINFNEPIEQLLYLAAEYTNAKPDAKFQATIKKINQQVEQFTLFNARKSLINQIGAKIFPLDFVSGYCLTLALQRYGQNERSLFSFLESKEFRKVSEDQKAFFNLIWLHDYLWVNFYSFLRTKNNPDFNNWNDIVDSIDRVEALSLSDTADAIDIIKVIGMLNIFTSKGARINKDFLLSYLEDACQIKHAKKILTNLTSYKIVKYSSFNDSYQLFKGTDVDIEDELKKAGKSIDIILDVAAYLKKHFGQLPSTTAKEVTYHTGTPRSFQFVVSEVPKYLKAENEIDGYINLIINESITEQIIIKHTENDSEANIYGLFTNSSIIKDYLIEIEKAIKVRANNEKDHVVVREMDIIINSNKNLLKHYFIDAIYTGDVHWYYKGQLLPIKNKAQFNKQLSRISNDVYNHTPIFRNELVNRQKISSSIYASKKEFFERLVNRWTEENLGYDDRFPADKTIYISLLRQNEMHVKSGGGYILDKPSAISSFNAIWDECERFLNSTREEQRPISELINILLAKPYKLKLGLIEFWLPVYLFIKRDDFALFGENVYIPEINETILLLIIRNPNEYSIKAFNIDGVRLSLFNKYRELLLQKEELKPNNNSFIESIKPFIIFYKNLQEYTKHTKKGLSTEAIAIREAITKAKDPEKTFFEDFPRALHTSIKELNESESNLQDYTARLKTAITEIRTAYDQLVARFEEFLCKQITGTEIEFELYKSALQKRFKGIKSHMILQHHKAFLARVSSPIDDKSTWLSSIAQSLVGKSLEMLKDEDVVVLYEKLKDTIHELDNFTELSDTKVDEKKERIFRFEITADKTAQKAIIKIPKTKFEELDKVEKQVKGLLKNDRQLNIALLTKLLQEQLNNDKS